MSSKIALSRFKILISDADLYLSSVTRMMLNGMGFSNVVITNSGASALALLKNDHFDFLITDWNLKEVDGADLMQQIRHGSGRFNYPAIPVIMLTGRQEISDVHQAREAGVNEYMLKPSSTQGIYHRLKRIIETPRPFIVHEKFVGPDRRRRVDSNYEPERRKLMLAPRRRPLLSVNAIQAAQEPQMWLPDFSMKHKLGHEVSLDALIPEELLNRTQAEIEMAAERLKELIAPDLMLLRMLLPTIPRYSRSSPIIGQLTESALSISCCCGTLGHADAAKIAYQLYIFFRKHLVPQNAHHTTVIKKYMEALELITTDKNASSPENIRALMMSLEHLTAKYTSLQLS